MRRGSHLLSCWVLAMDSAAHKDNKDELPVALKSYAELVFSVPHETALVEFIFSIMDVVQAGRRSRLHSRSVHSSGSCSWPCSLSCPTL